MSERCDVAVLALGNVLMGDDALGPAAIAHLNAHWEFGEGVEIEDLGTPGLDLHPHLVGRRAVILVDTVRAEGEPGEVRSYRRDAVLAHAPTARTSPHDPGVKEALLALEFAGGGPSELLLVGVIPERVGNEVGLSSAVRDAIPAVERAVVAELGRLGHAPVPRDPPATPRLWWEETPGTNGHGASE